MCLCVHQLLLFTNRISSIQNTDRHMGQEADPVIHVWGLFWSCLLANHLPMQCRHHIGRHLQDWHWDRGGEGRGGEGRGREEEGKGRGG